MQLEGLIGADLLELHLCSLQYLKDNKKRLQFRVTVCAICNRFRNDPDVGSAAQMRFVDRVPLLKRKLLKVVYNFMATLPGAVCSDFDEEMHVRVEETAVMSAPSPESATEPSTGASPDTPISNLSAGAAAGNKS